MKADDARALARKSYTQKQFDEKLAAAHEAIEEAAKRGTNQAALYFFSLHNERDRAVIDKLVEDGFSYHIEHTGNWRELIVVKW
jgi:hypothetical protein